MAIAHDLQIEELEDTIQSLCYFLVHAKLELLGYTKVSERLPFGEDASWVTYRKDGVEWEVRMGEFRDGIQYFVAHNDDMPYRLIISLVSYNGTFAIIQQPSH